MERKQSMACREVESHSTSSPERRVQDSGAQGGDLCWWVCTAQREAMLGATRMSGEARLENMVFDPFHV